MLTVCDLQSKLLSKLKKNEFLLVMWFMSYYSIVRGAIDLCGVTIWEAYCYCLTCIQQLLYELTRSI